MSTRVLKRDEQTKFVEPTVELRDPDTSPVDVVIVKFTVNKQDMIPTGIPERDRGTDAQSDVRQQFEAMKAGQTDLTEVGRVRPGRVDTGEQRIIVQGNGTHVDFLRRNLTAAGFRLTAVQYYKKETAPGKAWSKTKFVIECVYNRITAELEPFDDTKAQEALRVLATTTFNNCFVWVNPNQVCTINLSGRTPDEEPDGSLELVDGALQYVKNDG